MLSFASRYKNDFGPIDSTLETIDCTRAYLHLGVRLKVAEARVRSATAWAAEHGREEAFCFSV